MKTLIKTGLLALAALTLSAAAQAHEFERQRWAHARGEHRGWEERRVVYEAPRRAFVERERCAAPAPVVYAPVEPRRIERIAVQPGVQIQLSFGL
jgi:hypothetical protein